MGLSDTALHNSSMSDETKQESVAKRQRVVRFQEVEEREDEPLPGDVPHGSVDSGQCEQCKRCSCTWTCDRCDAIKVRSDAQFACLQCELVFCSECRYSDVFVIFVTCKVCEQQRCVDCAVTCDTCKQNLCEDCVYACEWCDDQLCKPCEQEREIGYLCLRCDRPVCDNCKIDCVSCKVGMCPLCVYTCDLCGDALCMDCRQIRDGEYVSICHKCTGYTRCDSCGRRFREQDLKKCADCSRYICSSISCDAIVCDNCGDHVCRDCKVVNVYPGVCYGCSHSDEEDDEEDDDEDEDEDEKEDEEDEEDDE